MDDNFISIALNNLPKGKTGLSGSKGSADHWELSSDGTFKIETYQTIQQTETLSELEFDSINPTVTELINLLKNNKNKINEQAQSKRKTSQATAPKKQRIE